MDFEKLTLTDAKTELGNKVYEACWLLEKLEGTGKIHGNGHHLMQAIAEYAQNLLDSCWVGEKS